MTEEQQGQATPENPDTPESGDVIAESEGNSEAPPQRAFSQKDVDKMAANRAKEAKQAERQKIAQDAEFGSIEEVLEAAKAFKTIEAEGQTEAEKAKVAAESARAKIEAEKAAVEAERDEALTLLADFKQNEAVEKALYKAGANPERLKATMKFVDMDALDIDDEGDVTGVEEAIKPAKQDFPEGFGKPSGSKPTPDGANPPTNQQLDKAAMDAERQRLAATL